MLLTCPLKKKKKSKHTVLMVEGKRLCKIGFGLVLTPAPLLC